MMNKIYSSAIIMALVSLVACNKEGVQTVGETLSANAYISSGTKTEYATCTDVNGKPIVKVTWSDKDSFKAYYDGSKNPIIFSKTAAGTSFSVTDVPEGVSAETVFKGLYGSKASLTSDRKIKIRFDEQNGTLEKLKDFDVMTATSELKDGALTFAFKHNCAILKVELENISKKGTVVNKLLLSFTRSKVDDAFFSSYSSIGGGESCMTNSNQYTGYNSLYITLSKSIKPGETHTCYIVVPAMEHVESGSDGINVGSETAFDYTVSLNSQKRIEAGKLYTLKEPVKFNDGYVIGNPD